MKKVCIELLSVGLIGLGAYVLTNKNTKNKADKLINNMLNKANMMTSNQTK